MRAKWLALALLPAIVAIGVTGCKRGEEPAGDTAAAGEPYRIGAVFAVTGSAAWLGEPEKKTIQLLAEQLNADGGINGRPVEVIIEDTEGDEGRAVNAVNKLIGQDKVIAIIGPSRSGVTMAVVPITEEAGIPLFSCAAAQAIVDPAHRYTFQSPQQDRHAVRKIYGHMKENGISRVAILSGTTGFGKQGRNQLLELAGEYEIEIVGDETYAPQDTDMTAQLTKLKSADPEAIVNWSIVPGQALVIKNMRALGYEIPLYQSHGFGNLKYVEAAGEAAEGVLFPASRLLICDSLPDTHPEKKTLVAYKTAYEDAYGEPASTFGGHAFDAFNMLVAAIEKAGDEPDAIRDALESTTDYVGTAGAVRMSAEDHNGLSEESFDMQTVRDGKFAPAAD